MDEDKKRINVEDLQKGEEELTSEDARGVQGGARSNTIGGALRSSVGNTIGGATSDDADPAA